MADRLVRVKISPEAVIEMIKPRSGMEIVQCEGLPADAKVVRTFLEESPLNQLPTIVLVVWSHDFPIVPEGEVIPEQTVTCHRYIIGAAA